MCCLGLEFDAGSMIEDIRQKVLEGRFILSVHADNASRLREISDEEIIEAILEGEIIEDYPNDKYGPSCLILGYTELGRPLHVQCTYPTREPLKVITMYQPDPTLWIGSRIRRE